MDVQNSESIAVTSQPVDQNAQQTGIPRENEIITPRLQNRRCGVVLWKEEMPDGKSVRIVETLDAPVAFSVHPEFVKTINEARMEIYGEEGKMYIVKNVPVPEGKTAYYLDINTKSGKEISRKVYTAAEANERLAKDRAEIERNRAKNIRRYGESNADGGFHTLQDAINSANDKKSTAIAANNN